MKDVLDVLFPLHLRYDGDAVTTGMAVALINFCTGLASVWCWIRVVRMALA